MTDLLVFLFSLLVAWELFLLIAFPVVILVFWLGYGVLYGLTWCFEHSVDCVRGRLSSSS